jgi:hypothetical protein
MMLPASLRALSHMSTRTEAANALILGTLLLAAGCGNEATTVTAPPTSDTTNFAVTGVVTNDQGVPVGGAVITMAQGAYPHWPSTVSDASGAYLIAFPTTATGGFVARAQVVAEGYELYWRGLYATSSNSLVASFALYPIKRVPAGNSIVVGFPSDVGECTGWVAARCGIIRVTVAHGGTLTVQVTPEDRSAAQPALEMCCVGGSEIYGNPLTLSVDGGESTVLIALQRGSTAAESFVVKTSLRAN